MVEEPFVGGTQVVEPPFAIGCPSESMLWALAVAGESNTALAAVLRKLIAFGISEVDGHLTVRKFTQRGVHHISKLVVWIYVVVAGIDIAIMFHGEGTPAGL